MLTMSPQTLLRLCTFSRALRSSWQKVLLNHLGVCTHLQEAILATLVSYQNKMPVALLVGELYHDQKVMSSIPSQNTCLGCGFSGPSMAWAGFGGNLLMFLSPFLSSILSLKAMKKCPQLRIKKKNYKNSEVWYQALCLRFPCLLGDLWRWRRQLL